MKLRQTAHTSIKYGRRLLWLFAMAAVVTSLALLVFADPRGNESFGEDFWIATNSKVERGRYLALAGNCHSCHSASGDKSMAGGVPFQTPFGTVYSTNITPDIDTGIGGWTGKQFLDSMRHGIRPNGERLYPAFPYPSFTKITDDDVAALYVYLMSIPAIPQAAEQNELSFPFNLRFLMAGWSSLFLDAGAYEQNADESDEWNRGAYLVEALAHCSACHTPRNFLGAEKSGMPMTGGEYLDNVRDGTLHPWSAPNLTSAPNALGAWPREEVVAYLKTGMNAYVEVFGPMNKVVQNSTRHLNDEDIRAMAIYLDSLPANKPPNDAPIARNVLGMGRTVYNLHCGTCHLPTGLGDEEQGPRIAGASLVVQATNPASLINVILYGPELPDPPLETLRRKPMDEFQYELTDDEVAAVASYLRASWGNTGGVVTAAQVAAQR